jgi:hypothetical protein
VRARGGKASDFKWNTLIKKVNFEQECNLSGAKLRKIVPAFIKTPGMTD